MQHTRPARVAAAHDLQEFPVILAEVGSTPYKIMMLLHILAVIIGFAFDRPVLVPL